MLVVMVECVCVLGRGGGENRISIEIINRDSVSDLDQFAHVI